MGILSTAVRNEKAIEWLRYRGISMEKVKVQRYMSCKRPDYAKDYFSSEETDLEDFLDSRLLTTTSQHDKRHRKHGREEFTKKQTSNQDEVTEGSSEYEEETEIEKENESRLKLLFVHKRDRATIQEKERETAEREQLVVDCMRTLTDEEHRQNLRVITNKADKGKYKFLQKSYHRGAFYLNEENNILKRDATLEDHFNNTILSKVMQIKNSAKCGRIKYRHLVDQVTTKFDSP
uniref:MFAP1 domain-containing protein n=1 Tax=Glossina austeni TaxID=7395 RepID=A0A1A9V5T4_GLOAU